MLIRMNGFYDPANFPACDSIGYLIKRCGLLMSAHIERVFAEQGWSFTQWQVLMQLREQSPQTSSELSRTLGHDQGALSRVLDSLEQADLVQRRRSESDRRNVELRLTPAGSRQVEDQLVLVVGELNRLMEIYTPEEGHKLLELLQRMHARLLDERRQTGTETPAEGAARGEAPTS